MEGKELYPILAGSFASKGMDKNSWEKPINFCIASIIIKAL